MESRRASADPKRVLVVDGKSESGAVLAQGLRRRGFDVAIAPSSGSAFESACHVLPSAIVVALEEPAAEALALMRTFASDSRTQAIPVIVTRCDDESIRTQAQRIGNVVVLLGDCSAETVAAEVERVVLESASEPGSPLGHGFPAACPNCAEQSGVPRSVSTGVNGGTYISLFCEKCSQEWRVFRQSDAPGFIKP